MTAYELLAGLEVALGRKLTPPTVYRALDYLVTQGLVSRIESGNAYVPCADPGKPHACVFLICDQCGSSEELEDRALESLMEHDAASRGFRIVRRIVELRGLCVTCRGE